MTVVTEDYHKVSKREAGKFSALGRVPRLLLCVTDAQVIAQRGRRGCRSQSTCFSACGAVGCAIARQWKSISPQGL